MPTFTPASLSFQATTVGSAAAAQTVTVRNGNATPLGIFSSALTGPNSTDFSVSANTCGASLPANGSCTFSVGFTPAGSGARTASVQALTSASRSPVALQLSGMGGLTTVATPTFTLAAGAYASAQTVKISTTTSGATIFYTTDGSPPTSASTQYSGPVSVLASETVNAIAVENGFTQSAVATAAYTIGVLGPVTLSPTLLNFLNYYPGQGSVTLTNSGGVPIAIQTITPSAGFTQYNDCGSVLPGQTSCSIEVVPVLSLSTPTSGTLTVIDSDTVDPQVVTISNSYSAVDLGTWGVGVQSSSSLSIPIGLSANHRDPQVSAQFYTDGQNDFPVEAPQGNPCEYSTNCYLPIQVFFKPQSPGQKLVGVRDWLNSGAPMLVSGTGVAAGVPAIYASPWSVTTIEGTSASATVPIINSGTNALRISGLSAFSTSVADAVVSGTTCAGTLASGGSCTFTITYTPLNGSATPEGISVAVVDTLTGQSAITTGQGTANFAVTAPPSYVQFGQVKLGGTYIRTLNIMNPGARQLTIAKAIGVGASFAVSPLSCAAVVCTITFTYMPVVATGGDYGFFSVSENGTPVLSLSATGSPGIAHFVCTPNFIDFGSIPFGSSATVDGVTVTNTGDPYPSTYVNVKSDPSPGISGISGFGSQLDVSGPSVRATQFQFYPQYRGSAGEMYTFTDATTNLAIGSCSAGGSAF